MRHRWWVGGWAVLGLVAGGCTVKAVGDPKRPITIEAHVTLDIKGLQQTASSIEDQVSQGAAQKGGYQK